MSSLHTLHYNDIYHVIPKGENYPLLQFFTAFRSRKKDHTLQLFSGDAFGGSRLSTLTEGKIMPWLLANVKGSVENKFPLSVPFKQHIVIERSGIRIGIVGLHDKDSYECSLTQWTNAKYDPQNPEATGILLDEIVDVGLECSTYLRNVEKCDIVIGLTHASLSSDLTLARELNALAPAAQDALDEAAKSSSTTEPFCQTHGLDIIFGGHDHFYYVSKGISTWDNRHGESGRENEGEGVLVVKSGTNFYDLSDLTLDLEDTPEGSIRRKVIRGIKGEHIATKTVNPDADVAEIWEEIIKQVPKGETELMGRFDKPFQTIEKITRTGEVRFLNTEGYLVYLTYGTRKSMVCNWVADIILPCYNRRPGIGRVDGVIIGAGSIRDINWPSDKGTVLDSFFNDNTLISTCSIIFKRSVMVLSLKGADIWAAMNHAFSKWPGEAGRFPVISGFRVTWDSRKVALKENPLTGVWMLTDEEMADLATNPIQNANDERGTPVHNSEDGPNYKIATLSYMVGGGDGFGDILKEDPKTGRRKPDIKKEAGKRLDDILEKFLKGRLEATDQVPSVSYDPITDTILQVFAHGFGGVLGAAYLASLVLPPNLSIGEWAELRPAGPKPIPAYHLFKDGRLLDIGRLPGA
ncbi:hypothetical protein HWV62_16334 [Athelia sp. TMB]|nr:hypothetical protein HWV62_16334 [Athelia sp. TMB]